MIPDFKTYLKESIWSDIHKRSNGVQIRKEDDYIDKLDFNEFIQYLDDTYESTDSSVENIDVHPSFSNPSLQLIQIPIEKIGERIIPPVTINYQTKGTGFNGYDVEKPSCVVISSILFKSYPELVDNLEREYDLEYPTLRRSYIVDTKSGPMKNSDCIKILDIVLSMVKEPVVIKKLGESVWADIHKRSNGSQGRKEDDVNHLEIGDFTNYLIDRYKVIDTSYDFYIEYNYAKNIIVPILARKLNSAFCFNLVFDEHNKVIYLSKSISEEVVFSKIYEKLKNEYRLDWVHINGPKLQISPKEGEVTNSFFVDVIDFIIDNTSKNNLVIDRK